MRSVARTLILIASTLLAVVLLAAPASAAVCSTPFGSLPKDPAMGTGEVDSLRAGRHDCFDRLVVDIDGPPAGYNVRYVDQVIADGSGAVVPTPGGARLQVIVRHPSFSPVPLPNVAGYSTFRSVTNAGSFEGQTTYGLGVRARLPFRVFTIAGGHGRIVVDVAHHWTA
ncbi:AMIN-like domain-containing (lipo)protein [Pseudonocardia charpentierae]|jgi:hypothetical protein|uniref:AMIN-like domain-containing protein n=1 Tax=Pseudonocardia charpentierae TaxID=3075545 RepID=A0ABU2NIB2_9PSEU|nr:hypothetical protein [Pseudonocardia sp. DSM 45834]MDT0353705.1 hypothetical protein [Pseudonocardia sp. DSM 45834]